MDQILDQLLVWRDPVERSGPENMAVDEVLFETLGGHPLLRFYDWDGGWVSLGYFQNLAEARRLFPDPGLGFVRRMTGGGIVDHRNDLTYSLFLPRGIPLAEARGDLSYRTIHAALAEALGKAGRRARMVTEEEGPDSAACFEKAVAWDLVDDDDKKLAGAGQKRSRTGLLHQGSTLVPGPDRAGRLADALADTLARNPLDWTPSAGILSRAEDLAVRKYALPAWMARR